MGDWVLDVPGDGDDAVREVIDEAPGDHSSPSSGNANAATVSSPVTRVRQYRGRDTNQS